MDGLGLADAPQPHGRALDLAFLCGEPVGRWDEVRVGDGPVRPGAPCTDLLWLTGLWDRRESSGLGLLAYLDPAPATLAEQEAVARRILREVPWVVSLRLVMRAPSGRYRVVVRDTRHWVESAGVTIEWAARAVSGGWAFF